MSKSTIDPRFGIPYPFDPRQMEPNIQAPPMIKIKQKDVKKQIFLKKALKAYKIVKLIEEINKDCNHVDEKGSIALSEPDEKGYRRCRICGKRFKLIEPDSKEDFDSILESAKIYSDPKVYDRIKSMLK